MIKSPRINFNGNLYGLELHDEIYTCNPRIFNHEEFPSKCVHFNDHGLSLLRKSFDRAIHILCKRSSSEDA